MSLLYIQRFIEVTMCIFLYTPVDIHTYITWVFFCAPLCCFYHSVMNADWNSDLFTNWRINLACVSHLFQFDWFILELIVCERIFFFSGKTNHVMLLKRCKPLMIWNFFIAVTADAVCQNNIPFFIWSFNSIS